jgi:DNA-binding CsgD family transcriptional regulator
LNQAPASAPLDVDDYERIFSVLEDVSAASSRDEFRSTLVDSIGRQFNIQHVTYFRGPSLSSAFRDPEPYAAKDLTRRGIREYLDRWSSADVFTTEEARDRLHHTGTVTLHQVRRRSVSAKQYVAQFLHQWNLTRCAAFTFRPSADETVVIGVFDSDPQALRVHDLAALGLLRRHLPTVARSLEAQPASAPSLTVRQRQLADLVALGLTNAEIGRRLFLAEDTVKKYVSILLARTGCTTRTELAVRAMRWPSVV